MSVIVLLLCTILTIEGHNIRHKKVEKLGLDVTLHCWDEEAGDSVPEPRLFHWALPNTHIIYPTYDNTSEQSVYLINDVDLYINQVNFDHLGSYMCFHEYKRQKRYRRVELSLPGLWEIYKMNVIIGCAAAGAVLVLFTVGCCVHSLRYERKMEGTNDSQILHGYENRSFSPSEYDMKKELPSRYDQVEIGSYEPAAGEGATKM